MKLVNISSEANNNQFSRELGHKLTHVFHFNINLQLTYLKKKKKKTNKNITCFYTTVQYIKHMSQFPNFNDFSAAVIQNLLKKIKKELRFSFTGHKDT